MGQFLTEDVRWRRRSRRRHFEILVLVSPDSKASCCSVRASLVGNPHGFFPPTDPTQLEAAARTRKPPISVEWKLCSWSISLSRSATFASNLLAFKLIVFEAEHPKRFVLLFCFGCMYV